jgi:hypothetical protein
LAGALALFRRVEDQAALHLAADAAQRARRQHAFGRAADAEIDVDAGLLGSAHWMTPATSPSVIRRMPRRSRRRGDQIRRGADGPAPAR